MKQAAKKATSKPAAKAAKKGKTAGKPMFKSTKDLEDFRKKKYGA